MSSTQPALFLLDADTSSYFVRGRHPELRTRVLATSKSELAISAITRAEILYGLIRRPMRHDLQVSVRAFLSTITTLAWPPEAADPYASICHQLISTGQTIGELDMLLAAHAVAIGATLVTNNLRHFQRIDLPLQIENWADA